MLEIEGAAAVEVSGGGDSGRPALGRLLFSISEVAEALCVSSTTVRALTHQGDLPSVRIGSRMLYLREDVEAFVESLREDADCSRGRL